jgi:four helix bundle protein
MEKKKQIYDLEQRTSAFGKEVVRFAKQIPKNIVTVPLITQFVRAGTSIGANYCEADCAESRKDFEHKIGISKKEAKETRYWLEMIAEAMPTLKEEAYGLRQEANELQLIFISIVKNSRLNKSL